MLNEIKSVHFPRENCGGWPVKQFGVENAKIVNGLHKSFPGYAVTPLVELKSLANHLGIETMYVKDESYRYGLNAFKGLGGSYSIAKYIVERLDLDMRTLSYDELKSPSVKEALGDITFVTATDGNHGRGIAWTASELGYKSVIFMPKGSASERLENIKAFGGEAYITDMNYDDTVRYATEYAEKNGGVLVQDTAWDGEQPRNEFLTSSISWKDPRGPNINNITKGSPLSELPYIFIIFNF